MLEQLPSLLTQENMVITVLVVMLGLSLNANRQQYNDRRADFKNVYEVLESLRESLAILLDRGRK